MQTFVNQLLKILSWINWPWKKNRCPRGFEGLLCRIGLTTPTTKYQGRVIVVPKYYFKHYFKHQSSSVFCIWKDVLLAYYLHWNTWTSLHLPNCKVNYLFWFLKNDSTDAFSRTKKLVYGFNWLNTHLAFILLFLFSLLNRLIRSERWFKQFL